MFFTILHLIFSWLVVAFTLMGIGLLFEHLVAGRIRITTGSLLMSFWPGLAVLFVIMNFWHIFFAVNIFALGIIWILSLAGFYLNREQLKNLILNNLREELLRRQIIPLFFIYFSIALVMAFRVLGKVIDYNMDLYQLQIIEWYTNIWH